jgi:hypothetical protein
MQEGVGKILQQFLPFIQQVFNEALTGDGVVVLEQRRENWQPLSRQIWQILWFKLKNWG